MVCTPVVAFSAFPCKPSSVSSCLSALTHFGHHCLFVLSTCKEDGNSLLHRDIAAMKREIALYYRAKKGIAVTTYDVDHSTPLGQLSVELILSALGVVSEEAFRDLRREDKHHIWASLVQHTVGMRFGHFLARDYKYQHFTVASDGAYRLVTDWHRYQGQRRYVLTFAVTPQWRCLWYNVTVTGGSVATTLTAATVTRWHFRMLQEAGESSVFRPLRLQ